MRYLDAIYGEVDIEEPVLFDLMQTQAMQRLRGVLQHGITALIGITRPVTRFDHSLGVMLLVRRLGGALEEQIAALLHDVSHTAFSHVIDYVVDGHDSQSYHEEWKESHLAASDVPHTLARYGYDWRDFLHEENYPLLEQPAPRLTIGALGMERSGMPILFVQDNGLGIAPEYHERIFGLFNKLDAKTEGTGVGLALVKRIIDLHGGHIWVESDGVGHGSTFFFTLPRPTPSRPTRSSSPRSRTAGCSSTRRR